MSISKITSNRVKVYDYFSTFLKNVHDGDCVYIDMDKINNFHIFNQKYSVFHYFNEYISYKEKTLFNVYVSPIDDHNRFSMLSLLVKVDDCTVNDILTSLSITDPRVKKKYV